MAKGSVNQPTNAITTAQIELRVLNSRKVSDIQCATETIAMYYIRLCHYTLRDLWRRGNLIIDYTYKCDDI
ncbi:hypothetical protein WN48_04302 [Eufriesea mexicana]|uniref:Uncharacterized protein n=1 Tax=Eufriesea mexicana TaxID=516756 RepID=A0A310SJE6_9HYME|nr:hypothetical protein WN48_04302 [Eufriesea mexicana]